MNNSENRKQTDNINSSSTLSSQQHQLQFQQDNKQISINELYNQVQSQESFLNIVREEIISINQAITEKKLISNEELEKQIQRVLQSFLNQPNQLNILIERPNSNQQNQLIKAQENQIKKTQNAQESNETMQSLFSQNQFNFYQNDQEYKNQDFPQGFKEITRNSQEIIQNISKISECNQNLKDMYENQLNISLWEKKCNSELKIESKKIQDENKQLSKIIKNLNQELQKQNLVIERLKKALQKKDEDLQKQLQRSLSELQNQRQQEHQIKILEEQNQILIKSNLQLTQKVQVDNIIKNILEIPELICNYLQVNQKLRRNQKANKDIREQASYEQKNAQRTESTEFQEFQESELNSQNKSLQRQNHLIEKQYEQLQEKLLSTKKQMEALQQQENQLLAKIQSLEAQNNQNEIQKQQISQQQFQLNQEKQDQKIQELLNHIQNLIYHFRQPIDNFYTQDVIKARNSFKIPQFKIYQINLLKTNKKLIYDLNAQAKRFVEMEDAFSSNFSYSVQINNDQMITIGNQNKQSDYTNINKIIHTAFTSYNLIHPKTKTQLVYDNNSNVFIISGKNKQEQYTSNCEKFDIQNNKTVEIADSILQILFFGSTYTHDLIYTFGGLDDTGVQSQRDKVTFYDTIVNIWINVYKRLPLASFGTSAV